MVTRRTRECDAQVSPSTGPHPSILCPTCGHEYVRLGHPQIDRDGDTILPGECEAGHRFEIVLAFYKGITSMFCRVPKFTVIEGGRR